MTGEPGKADTGEMEMPLPDNTLPMMTGQGPYGALEMGGMFTTLKVRRGLARDDYRDPGWFAQPPGTQAREWTGALAEPARGDATRIAAGPAGLTVRKPGRPSGHGH